MQFEFDLNKSESNRDKYGIDFLQAQALWNDPGMLKVAARTEDEPRYIVIGKIEAKLWTAVITYRGDAIRIISARRSTPREAALYEG
ncbi:MAG: BrnT family toxin [Xanthomonadales bacterium]|nr:BrnT family toxin [Xanthomonadales bacterium]